MPTHDLSQLTENPIVEAKSATASDNLVYKKKAYKFLILFYKL